MLNVWFDQNMLSYIGGILAMIFAPLAGVFIGWLYGIHLRFKKKHIYFVNPPSGIISLKGKKFSGTYRYMVLIVLVLYFFAFEIWMIYNFMAI